MKKFIFASLLLLVSCAKKTTDYTGAFAMPDEMKGCRVYALSSEDGTSLVVVHCPHANTTTKHSCGKSCTRNNAVISE